METDSSKISCLISLHRLSRAKFSQCEIHDEYSTEYALAESISGIKNFQAD